jgi:hypothetical protein
MTDINGERGKRAVRAYRTAVNAVSAIHWHTGKPVSAKAQWREHNDRISFFLVGTGLRGRFNGGLRKK